MRNILLANLERSLTTADLKERQALQNIVIVGGGATGVEVSGALSEMKRFVIPKDYPEMEVHKVNIYLIEATPKLLSAMSPQASANAEKFLRGMGVNVMLNTLVQDYREGKVILDNGMDIPTRNFIWVSGVTGTSFDNIGSEFLGRGRRIKVDEHNKVIGLDNVFAIGDVSIMTAEKDYPNGHPQLAQVAIQQGDLLASNLKNMEKGKKLKPFHYRNLGSLATVGRNKAVADFNQLKMHANAFFASFRSNQHNYFQVVAFGYDSIFFLIVLERQIGDNHSVNATLYTFTTEAFKTVLHGSYLWSTRKSSGRESINKCLNCIGTFIEFTTYTRYQVNYVTVILYFLIEIYLYVVSIATQIVTS